MRIFDSIKKGFNDCVLRMKNKWNVHKKLLPYFDKREQFTTLRKIDEIIDEDINKIYQEVKVYNPIKYATVISRYEDFLPRVREHNKIIDSINEKIKGFNFHSFVEAPILHNINEINSYVLVVNKIKTFTYFDEIYSDFCNKVLEIKNNYEFIKEQYSLLDLYSNAFDFKGDYYFDISKKNDLINKLEPLFSCLKKTGKCYYDFSKLEKIDYLIEAHNNEYVKNHKKDLLFNNIRSNSLDEEQREAILREERANLTIAGAGSGKTLTICGKVRFLLEIKKVNPEDILLLSYSKKSADDLSKKVKAIDERLTVGTFHKLGLDILKETQNTVFDVEEQYNAIIEYYFRQEIKNSPEMLQKVLEYFAFYSVTTKQNKKYDTQGEMYEDLKKCDYRTLKTLVELSSNPNKKETIKKEIVKSFEEMAIANFYFINGIEYIYEKPYEFDVSTAEKRQYN